MKKNIYVLHEYGAPTHYWALQELANDNGYGLRFYELWSWKFVIKHPSRWWRYLINKLFWILIPLLPKSKFVLGIAPYNNKINSIMRKLRKHEVYYHTSYTCWDGSLFAHSPKSDETFAQWRHFTNQYVKHVFAVSNKTRDELVANSFALHERISVVNHSYKEEIKTPQIKKKEDTFVYVGRLSEQKGVQELLDIFSKHSDWQLTIVGDGPLKSKVCDYSNQYSNINYIGFVNGLKNLIPVYQANSFFVLNSKRTVNWEEFFGLSVIEGMACGCVPICTDHSGPIEIVENGVNGFISPEGGIKDLIIRCANVTQDEYQGLRKMAILRGKEFLAPVISSKWKKILE